MSEISVCIITKNESDKLSHCIEALKDKLSSMDYEIIVTDTGSTDNSVDVARKAGAKVEFFEWCNDFAAARNYSIAKASSDNILSIDTDEYLIDIDAKEIRSFFTDSPNCLGMIKINNFFTQDGEKRQNSEWLARLFSRKYLSYY